MNLGVVPCCECQIKETIKSKFWFCLQASRNRRSSFTNSQSSEQIPSSTVLITNRWWVNSNLIPTWITAKILNDFLVTHKFTNVRITQNIVVRKSRFAYTETRFKKIKKETKRIERRLLATQALCIFALFLAFSPSFSAPRVVCCVAVPQLPGGIHTRRRLGGFKSSRFSVLRRGGVDGGWWNRVVRDEGSSIVVVGWLGFWLYV